MNKVIATVSLALVVNLAAVSPVRADTRLLTEAVITKSNVNLALSRSFVLKKGSRLWSVPASQVKLWFKTRTGDDGATLMQLRPGAMYDYLNVNVSPWVNDLGEQSRFMLVNGEPQLLHGGRKGHIVDGVKTSLAIRAALITGQPQVIVAMKEQRPTVFSATDFKKLKFPDHLGSGESNFGGSPQNRRQNIAVATARYNGIVLLSGEEFSFNSYLGIVDAANGYKPELVIKEHVTTPEFGGGICQVSTTAFRAAMIAGLEVTARRPHSYPVKYYGKPGFDATVYQPAPDLRFRNDLPTPVLIKTNIAGSKLIFEVWGKSDGRQVTINGPFVTEKKPDGSLTAAVAQIVKKNGQTIREVNFVSKYQSPDKFPKVLKANGES